MPRSRRSAEDAQQVWRVMQAFVEANGRKHALQAALGFRLGGGRGKILFELRERAMTLTEIAESHGIDAPYATIVVDRLESLGLVERTAHPEDRRRKLVSLTDAGLEAAATAEAITTEPPPALLALPAGDLARLAELLTPLSAAQPPLARQ